MYFVKGKKTKPRGGECCIICGGPVSDQDHYIQTKRGTTHFVHDKCLKRMGDNTKEAKSE